MRTILKPLTLFLVGLCLIPSAHAATFFVANNGFDSGACGTRKNPCRSISAAYGLAAAGDTVSVGPGFYGDVNRDGDFDDPGDESGFSSSEAMIVIEKLVRFVSRDGAAVTIIDSGNSFNYTLYIRANSVSIGRKQRGFSIKGGNEAAVFVEGSSLKLQSSRLLSFGGNALGLRAGCTTDNDTGAPVEGRILDSIFSHNNNGVLLCDNTARWLFRNCEISDNENDGMVIEGDQHRLIKNTIAGNKALGVNAEVGRLIMNQNHLIGNGSAGASLGASESYSVKSSVFVGNGTSGLTTFADGSVTRSNIFGNFPIDNVGGGFDNCGVFTNGQQITYSRNFWGTKNGPGAEPGDLICSQLISFPPVPNLRAERRIKVIRPAQ